MIQIKRGASTVATVNPLSSSNMSKAVMGDEQITLVWEAPAFVPFYLGDYITVEGSNWTLNSLPTVKKLSQKTWQYNAIFQSTKYELLKAMYLLFDNTDTLPSGEFPLTGTADTFMELLVANLNRVAGFEEWTVGQVIENTDYKNLTFSNEDCLSVLARLADEFETEYHVSNHVIHLKKISTNREITLEYGSTLYDIERSSVDSSDVVTRLYPFGSTKNLASDYRGGNSPLRLPEENGNYIENNVNLYGIIERSKTFDDIYPRLSSGGAGVITSVGDEFTFYDSHLDFNVNDYLLDGTTAKVHFNTGECAGYDFEIALYNHTAKKFVIIANTQENDFTLPTTDLKPAIGDKYVLLDIIMPPAYLAAAEAELLAKAQEYINQNSTPKVAYKTTFSAIYAKQNLQNVECGDTVTVYDEDMGIDEQIRIIKLQKGLTDFWTVQFDLANTVTATRLERIEGNVAAVENTVIVTNERVNRNNLRAYQNTKELREMVFDPDGYFDAENIKPLSIETSMLSVGAKSQSLQLSCLLQPNYAGNPQVLQWSAGLLTHFTIADDQIKEWTISQGSITITGDNQTTALYIYARCNRSESTGDIYLSATATKFDTDATYYFFLLGVLHTPISSVRGISLTYGQTTINGQFIKTGVISSIDGATYFNLNTGEIVGNFKFQSGASAEEAISQAAAIAGSAQTTANNAATAATAAQTSVNNLNLSPRNLFVAKDFIPAFTTASNGTKSIVSNYSFSMAATADNCYSNTYDNLTSLRIPVTAGTTYYFAYKRANSTLGNAFIFFYNSATSVNYSSYNAKSGSSFYTTIPTGITHVMIRFGINTSGQTETFSDIIFCQSSNAVSWSPSPEDVQYYIGSQNLVIGSGNYLTTTIPQWIIDRPDYCVVIPNNGFMRFSTNNINPYNYWYRLPLTAYLDSKKTYSFSIKFRVSVSKSLGLYLGSSDGNNMQLLKWSSYAANTWNVLQVTFVPDNTVYNQFKITSSLFSAVSETFDIEYIQIEEGNTASAWKPSLQDAQYIANKIKIGGVNLLTGTNQDYTGWGQLGTFSIVNGALYTNNNYYNRAESGQIAVKAGDILTFSCNVLINTTSLYQMQLFIVDDSTEFGRLTFNGIIGKRSMMFVITKDCIIEVRLFGNSTVSGEFKINNIKLEYGCVPTDWSQNPNDVPAAVKHIADAITDGSTVVNGGLTLGNLFFTKDLNGNVNGGMSGLDGDNILQWGGATYAQAIADAAKAFRSSMTSAFLDKADGSGHKAFGNLAWDSDGQLFVNGIINALAGKIGGLSILDNALKSGSMSFAESPVETLESLLSPSTINIARQSSWSASNLSDGGDAVAYTQVIQATFDGQLKFKGTTAAPGIDPRWRVIIFNDSNIQVYNTSGTGTISAQLFTIPLAAGNYRIYLYSSSYSEDVNIFPNNTSYIQGDTTTDTISFYGYIAQTKIGNNGFYSFWTSALYFYFSSLKGLKARCNVDMPNGLGGATVSSGGSATNYWGKITSYTQVSKSGANITITHNIGDTNYVIEGVGNGVNVTVYQSSKSANSAVVVVSGTFSSGSVDLIIKRTI